MFLFGAPSTTEAPTAPDTLETKPFCTKDPFVIDKTKVPHVFFSGNHDRAMNRWQSSSEESSCSGTQCICVPAFHLQQAVVLVSLADPADVQIWQNFGEAGRGLTGKVMCQ